MPSIAPADEQFDILSRGVADLQPIDRFKRLLQESHDNARPLVIKTGFDPTAPDLHLGHTVLIEKMAQFQRLGHTVVFLVGDYTATIGDPTGRNTMRPPLSAEQIRANAATYTEQCFKILDRERTTIEWNSKWLAELTFKDVVLLLSRYNLGRMLERRDFRERFDANKQIALHELMYPLVQGYDSVVLKPDVELGGHDQIFNLNVGRHLMEAYGLPPQVVLTVPLLVGLDGVEKMSKSKGNHIGILEPRETMFAKIMSISDETMWTWIPLLAGRPADQSASPFEEKLRLSAEMVARFHGAEAATAARAWWDAGRPPLEKEHKQVAPDALYRVVVAVGAANSASDARRKIAQGGVYLDGERQSDPMKILPLGTFELRVGKKHAAVIEVR